jgi:hypothetical protein
VLGNLSYESANANPHTRDAGSAPRGGVFEGNCIILTDAPVARGNLRFDGAWHCTVERRMEAPWSTRRSG